MNEPLDKQPWHNNLSPDPLNWSPLLFLVGWLIVVALILPWALS